MLYRVWRAVPRADGAGSSTARLLFSVGSLREACWVIERLRAREQDDRTVPPGEYGLEVLSADGWTEWCDRRGRTVVDLVPSPREEVGVKV